MSELGYQEARLQSYSLDAENLNLSLITSSEIPNPKFLNPSAASSYSLDPKTPKPKALNRLDPKSVGLQTFDPSYPKGPNKLGNLKIEGPLKGLGFRV